ncbi:ABC-2 type transport system permease protein [Asanoa ferruginea]|uniref:Transport permease protein n=1 Tax=Asanoa ferruginea TaxID=53367 RepID=A0A3D9ZVU3_9ACTN|nr:ABC transporter permease [Asanoa ferruginea]REG01417.1 ABC-2 type transport system permease protein [Asanoa ferruginea]GIF47957.1 hypothetical protein Afe04nite_24960 [Asanoa ferruginea]
MRPDTLAGPRRFGVVARHQAVLLRRAPGPLLAYTVMPIVLTIFLEPIRASVAPAGTSGIDAAAPGMLVMFSLFMVGVVGDSLINEREWRTGQRLRTTPLRAGELLAGKTVPLFAALLAQQVAVLAFAAVGYGLDLAGAGWALAIVGAAWAVCVLGLGTALATLVRNHGQLSAVKDIAALVLAGLGGALVPTSLLPSWAAGLAPFSPAYWAMRGYADALAPRPGVSATAVVVLVATGLAGFALAVQSLLRPHA